MTIRRQGDDHVEVSGLVGEHRSFQIDEIAVLPGRVTKTVGSSEGEAVPVSALLDRVDIGPEADHVTVSWAWACPCILLLLALFLGWLGVTRMSRRLLK